MATPAVAGSKLSSEDARETDDFDNEYPDSGTATPTELISAEETGDVDTDQGKLRALLGILRKVVGVKVCLLSRRAGRPSPASLPLRRSLNDTIHVHRTWRICDYPYQPRC